MNDVAAPRLVPLRRPRALTAKERALLDFLLAGPLGKPELRRQAKTARVVGVCSCGCPSVQLEVDETAPLARFTPAESPRGAPDSTLIAATQYKARGTTDVVAHVLAGRLFELEIYAGDGVRPRVDLARLEHDDSRA